MSKQSDYSKAIREMSLKLFTIEELTTCSVNGMKTRPDKPAKPGLPENKKNFISGKKYLAFVIFKGQPNTIS